MTDQKDRKEQNGDGSGLHLCPPCNGTGLVTRPPGVAGDQESWVSTGVGPYRCRSCDGCGWIAL